ncbi:MAG: BamA/TamA family outer membrane protein, partial [Gemmatimonadota bacterium]|nr:BamA/TamA family outer membrane protein [Gemmatimonadota bacterium]
NDRLPTMRQLYDPRYFPYRFGQAFWAYVAGRWGDEVVGRILNAAGRTANAEQAIQLVLRIPTDSLISEWHESIQLAYGEVQDSATAPADLGRAILTRDNAGTLNSAPSLSPNGESVVFLSEKDLFAVEMFLADVQTGNVRRKIVKTALDPHFESLQFLNSAGAWSADGEMFAFGAVSRGQPVLSIVDPETGDKVHEAVFDELGEIINPTWSPDGRQVAFSAIVGGLSDLFVYDIETETLERLTEDHHAALQPAWAPEGNQIVYVTDRFGANSDEFTRGNYRLALIDVETGEITPVPSFPDAKNINPQWAADGRSIFFVANRMGISNVYRLDLDQNRLFQVTDLYTGVTGVTALSPAIATARDIDRLVFTAYEKGDYNIYAIEDPNILRGDPVTDVLADVQGGELISDDPDLGLEITAGMLPPHNRRRGEIMAYLDTPDYGLADSNAFSETEYRPRLSLDFLSRPYFTAGNDQFGTFIGGGASAFWSDMLGRHNLATVFQIDGGVHDIAAIVGYTNKRNRTNWGLTVGQIPQRYGRLLRGQTIDSVFGPVFIEQLDVTRQINKQFSLAASYPFSRVWRVEAGAGLQRFTFNREIQVNKYDLAFNLLEHTKVKEPFGRPLNLITSSVALVHDNSFFGATSPIMGQRYRVGLSPFIGSLNIMNASIDLRKYLMPIRPFTIAARITHFGRYGQDAEDPVLSDVYLGLPSLVRGYEYNSVIEECFNTNYCLFDDLWGSRVAVGSAELRFPLFGTFGIGPGMYGIFPAELAVFGDIGVAWSQTGVVADRPTFLGGQKELLASAGVALRLNVFGILLLEIDRVYPFSRLPDRPWHWQFALQPGF